MKKDELIEVYKIVARADGGCSFCVTHLAHLVWKKFGMFCAKEVANMLNKENNHTDFAVYTEKGIIDGRCE